MAILGKLEISNIRLSWWNDFRTFEWIDTIESPENLMRELEELLVRRC